MPLVCKIAPRLVLVIISLVSVVAVMVTVVEFRSNALVRSHPPDSLNHHATTKSEQSPAQGVISPFASHPPRIVPLDSNNPRHRCIRAIRHRQNDLLKPYIDAALHGGLLLVDPAYHSNVGDHMITLGELEFLDDNGRAVAQCSYAQAGDYVRRCEHVIPERPAAVAVWHGGGNWGDLWRRAQEPRIASLRLLLKNAYTVLTMPNSYFYMDETLEAEDVSQIRTNIAVGLGLDDAASDEDLADLAQYKVIFQWREHVSYERAVKHFPYVTNLLVPDIAFQLGPYQSIPPPPGTGTDLVLLLRDDHESVYAPQRNRRAVQEVLDTIADNGVFLTFSIVDWNDRLVRFGSSGDIFFTETAIQLLSLGKILICDRLHAAILAFLMDIPFVYLDQRTGKIKKTLDVAMESSSECSSAATMSWMRAENLTDALDKSAVILRSQKANDGTLSRQVRRNRLRNNQRVHSSG